MSVTERALGDVNTHGGGEIPPSTGLTPDALPEVQKPILAENSHTGVSTRNALSGSCDNRRAEPIQMGVRGKNGDTTTMRTIKRKPKDAPHWYALRVTYGREKKAYDYLVAHQIEAFYPTLKMIKEIDGKRRTVEESRLPNIFFAHGTENEIKTFVYDNVNLPYLRFYYRHFHEGAKIGKEPLVVPDNQIESLKIICTSEAEDVIIVPPEIQKFQAGQTVRVIDGVFKGVVGKVARYHGQQRVAVVIDGLLTVATAYVPSAFLEEII